MLAIAGSFLFTSATARADQGQALPPIDLRPNLKLSSTLGWQFNPITMTAQQVLSFSVTNNGLVAAPATKTAVSVEAGDPFSPIGTAITLQMFDTPALAPGAVWNHAISLGSGEAIYLRLDIFADYGNHVTEVTKNDNHRVHVIGYTP